MKTVIKEKIREHAPMIAGVAVASVAISQFVRSRRNTSLGLTNVEGGVNYPIPGAELYDYAPLPETAQHDNPAIRKLRRNAQAIEAKMERLVRKNPWVPGAIAVAAGVSVGMILPQADHERRIAADAVRQLKKSGTKLAHETIDGIKEINGNFVGKKLHNLVDEYLA